MRLQAVFIVTLILIAEGNLIIVTVMSSKIMFASSRTIYSINQRSCLLAAVLSTL